MTDLFDSFASVCQCAIPDEVVEEREWHVANSPNCEESEVVNSQGLKLMMFTWPPLCAPIRGCVVMYVSGVRKSCRS